MPELLFKLQLLTPPSFTKAMKQCSIFTFSICFVCLILLSDSLSAQNKTDSLDFKTAAIFKQYNNSNGPGCAIAIIQNDSVIFEKGYGMANLEYDIPITPATVFDIASVSKQFAGLAISTLIDQKKIFPDDDIRKYLPDVPDFGKTITIRHLVHHTSGLRDWPEALSVAGWRWDEVYSFEDIMRMVRHQKELDFEPGEKYSYSNTGYNLLAAIVKKVSGKSFREWTDENIFKPLQMNSSHFQDDYTKIIRNLAYSYTPGNNEFLKVPGSLTAYGSSSLFTTVQDLSKWVINFDKQIALKNPVYTNMLTEGTLNNGEKVHYGYGLGTGENQKLKTISHTGSWAGYKTILINYPTEKLSIIILSNSDDFNVNKYASDVADLFLKDKFKSDDKVADQIKDAPTIKLDSLLAKKYTGTYLLRPGKVITLTLENGRLMTQATGEEKFPTDAKSDSTIWIDAYGSSMTFVKDKTGNVNTLKYRNILVKRIALWNPEPAAFNQYTGTFYSAELEAEYKIDLENGNLKMHHMRLGDISLTADSTGIDRFNSDLGEIVFFRNSQKKVIGFKLSGGRIKNIRFDKR